MNRVGCKEQNPVKVGAFSMQLDIHKGAGKKASHILSGSTFPAPDGEGTLCEKPTPDKRQGHSAMRKRFSLCPDEVMDPGETA